MAVFVTADHCSASHIGIYTAIGGIGFEALQPIHQAVRGRVGAINNAVAVVLTS